MIVVEKQARRRELVGILWLILVDLRKGACVIVLVVDDPETIDRRGSIARKRLFRGIIVFQCKSLTQRGLDQGCPIFVHKTGPVYLYVSRTSFQCLPIRFSH